jgi:hypothetical protein
LRKSHYHINTLTAMCQAIPLVFSSKTLKIASVEA